MHPAWPHVRSYVRSWHMSRTIWTDAAWLNSVSRKSGVPRGRIIREQFERERVARAEKPFMRFAGSIRGARDLSARKGFSEGCRNRPRNG